MASLIALCAVSTVSAPAGAQVKRVLVLPLISDFLPQPLNLQIDDDLRDEVAQSMPRNLVLPRPPLDLASMKVAAGCATDGPQCLALIGRTAQANWVVQVSLLGTAIKARMVVRRVRSRTGVESTYEAELTDVGTESGRALRWHLATALGARPPPLTGRIVLKPDADEALDEAEILLDNRPTPSGELENVNPGRHRLEVRRLGFETFIRTVTVRPGRDTKVSLSFTPRSSPPPPVPQASASEGEEPAAPVTTPPGVVGIAEDSGPFWAWILGAGAVVAAGTATVFGVQVLGLESDAESARLDCDGPDRDAPVCRDGRTRALMANVTWGVAGALAVGATVAFILELSGDDEEEADDVTAHFGIAPTPDGVRAGLHMSF